MIANFDLQKILHNVSKIKLSGGIVGKVCIVLIVVALSMAAMAWSVKLEWVSVIAIILLFILTFVMLWRVINFANKNPQAAILEGAEFILYQQLMLGTKAHPQLAVDTTAFVEDHPVTLTPADQKAIMAPDEQPKSLPASNSQSKEDGNV